MSGLHRVATFISDCTFKLHLCVHKMFNTAQISLESNIYKKSLKICTQQFLKLTLLLVAKETTVRCRNFFNWTADISGKFAFSAENKSNKKTERNQYPLSELLSKPKSTTATTKTAVEQQEQQQNNYMGQNNYIQKYQKESDSINVTRDHL